MLSVKSSISNCVENQAENTNFFRGEPCCFPDLFFSECLPICFLSHLCFLYIPKGIKLFLVSFQAFLLHTVWKPVSFSFHPIFFLLEWALPSQHSCNCIPHKNAYYEWYTWKEKKKKIVWVVLLLAWKS